MADRCLNADILATTLLGNNEGFAKQIVGLAQEKNAISNIAWDSARTKQLTKQIDMQIQSMIEARILFWDAWDAAKQKLLKWLRNKWWTLWAWARLLDMIDSLSVENVEEYAWLVWKDRTDVAWVKQSITDLKFAVSDFIAAKNNLKVNYWTKFYNKLLKKSERIKALWDWWRADLKTVRSWWTPTELVNPDEQWRHIVNMTWGDLAKREKLFNNWVLWRTFLWEDDSAVTAFVTVAKKFDNTLPSITVDDINSFTNVNELINRVYTNTLDIAHSRELRFALKAKLIELIHQWDIPLTLVEDSIRLTNTTLFADAWDSLTSILKYDNTAKAVRNTLIDEKGKSRVSSALSSKEIFNELKKILERPWLKKELLWKDWKKLIQWFWTKLDWEELLKIIYAMSWDNEVKQVVEMHYAISDELIIDFAKAKLFWIDVKKWEKNLRDIIEKFSKPYSPDEISTMAFVATSWVPVKPTDNSKIAFVHFADENLTLEDDALMSRAKFNDDLAWVNTLTVTTTNIPTFDITNWVAHVPSDLEYVVIPNANVANSNRIKELKNKLEKYWKNNKYTIVFPKSRQSGQYFVDVDWKLKFKTTNTELFNEMSNKLAINSFNNATIDLTENTVENRELIQASNERRLQILNDDAVAFFKNYMWTAAEWLDDKQIIQKVSDMTGIPLDPNEANLAWDWELAQRVMLSNYTASWRYVKDIVTKDNLNSVEQTIRWMSDEEVLKEINKMWHTINKPTALKNIEAIREALINMKTTDSLIDYVWNKWVIIGLWNMDTVTNLTIENFKSILASDNPLEWLANLFFWWRAVTKAELESMNAYLSDIMDSLISDFSHNLLTDWYQMPLLSPRKAFMSYLKWDVNINDEFIQAFAFKNWLEEDYNLVKKIFDDHMPSEINVDWLINKDTLTSVRRENKGGLVVRELNENERFLPTTYNSYTAVMGKIDIPSQTFSRQTTRVTADGVRKILKRFFTDKELEWISINFYDNLIDWIWEGKYTSDWMRRALDFVRNPEEVTPYHETVHMYIDMFLTKEQREELLNGIYQKNKRAIWKFIRNNWYKVDDALAAAEEWIAENFIKFVKWQDVRLNKDTRNWFQKLWDTIKSWFNKIPEEKLDSLNQFYSDVYNRVRPEWWVIAWEWNVNIYRRWDYWYIWNHWSPYSFEEFSTEFKWTWEWWDAHWAWIYIAARKWTAEKYAWYGWDRQWWFQNMTKDYLESTDESDFMEWIYDRELIRRNMATNILDDMIYENKSFREAIEEETEWVESSLRWASRDDLREILNKRLDALREFKEEDFKLWPATHHLYEVEISAPKAANTPSWTNYLQEDWRYDMNVVNEIINKARKDKDWINDKWAMYYIEKWRTHWPLNMPTWRHIYLALENWFWNSTTKASNFLEWLWYDWIHYIWQDDWECWVVFNADNTYIVSHRSYRRASQPSQVANSSLTEDEIIRNILNKYENAVEQHIKNKTMTTKVAQDLKQQASYALNIATQDLILARYGSLLSASDREWLLWMWYNLKLASNTKELNALKQANAQTMWKFKERWGELAKQYNVSFSNTEELNKKLLESWKVFTERDWQQAVVDVWDELENSIKSIPDTAWEFASLKQLTKWTIRELSPRQAYIMLKTVDLVKNNITRGNFYTQLMYQLNPQLRKAVNWLDFFQSFKAVDVWWWVWVPWSLTSNATNWYVEAGKAVLDEADTAYKAWITKAIYEWYIRNWTELTPEALEWIVRKELGWTNDEAYAQHYIDAFMPYTNLKWLSENVKTYINQLLNQESNEVQALLKEAWADMDWLMDTTVVLDDWSTVAIKDIINWNVDWWKQRMFWWLSDNGDELYANKQSQRNIQEEMNWAYAWFNDVALVSDNQSRAITQILGNARKILQRDTHTQKFVEFDNAIGWQNDILKWLMQFYLFSWFKRWLTQEEIAKQSKTWVKIKHWLVSRKGMFSDDVWSDVQKIYEVYYSKTLRELNWITTPKDWVHQVALELAKYFKQLEQRLGSKNWATWVSVIPRVNIAFWNLWSVVRNVHSEDWVWSLMNKIGNNQVIWLFKFTREWESAYNEFLKNLATNKQSERWLSNALNWWSVELIEWNKREIQRQFNEVFGSNFSESDVNVIVQWLWWYQIVNSQWWKVFSKINSLIARAWRTTRMLMTYPFQLFTIHPQLFAYNVKSSTEKKILWVEDLSLTRDVRKKYWVLEWTYVELNPGGWIWENARKLKEIMSRDSDELTDVWLELDDWILWLYWKTTTYTDKKYTVPQQLALFDSLRDNANNIIDASQAQTFKWIAFLKALQKNDYMTFMNAEAFDAFMNRSDVSQAVKDKVLDKVNVYANRIFNDLLGTWFTWLDKAYWGWKVSDFFIWLLSTINFKGAWWTNIFRQTFEKLGTVLKVWWERYAKWNREAADEMRRYVISTPEFTNLTECLWWDMIWAWKMWKYGKNWYIPDDESEVEMMDYVSWIFDNIELVSQQWQWLISFWWTRPFTSAINAVYWTRDKWLESVWYWAWAFINSLVQNFWRWWKPWSLWVDALMVAERDWFWAWWDYLRENFYTLSAWTMRYMIEEWYNAYWANTALTNQPWWIPAFMVGNQYEGSDTAFSYKVRQYQTWDYLKNMFDKDEWSYARWELLSSVINASQFLKIWTNAVKSAVWWLALTVWWEIPDWAKSKKWVYSILDIQEDFEQSPTFIQFMETGKAMPPDQKKTNKLIELYTNANYPGWYKAYDWIQNFKNTGHVNWNKDKGYYYDEWLEEFYARIEQTSPWELDRFMKYYSTAFLWDPNGEAGRQFAYNWAVSWLNKFTDDSQYNVYASALYKGNLNNYYYEMLDAEARRLTEVRQALWFPKEQAKVSRTDINNLDDVKDAINRRFLEEHYDDMYRADAELMQNKIYQWIADELEPEVVNWYFTQQPEINYAGNETGEMEWVISNNIKWQIKDVIFIEKALDDWRWEDALTRWAILTQSLNYDDEMWLIRASAVDYYAYRIINSDWPDTVKQSALAWLIHNNEDVFKYNSELAKKYWEYYDAANEYKNEVLYNVTLDDINLLNAMAISLHQQWEDTKWWASSWVKVAAKLNNLRWALESSPSGWKWYWASGGNVKWAAVPIKWLSAMGYKPATVDKKIKFETVYKSQGYDPRTKTLWPITPPKKNKAIKGKSTRKMTQKEENELDLI